jgi:hypothetical protein
MSTTLDQTAMLQFITEQGLTMDDLLKFKKPATKPSKRRTQRQKPKDNRPRCIARKWNDGLGAQCTNPTKIGEFCGLHGRTLSKKKPCATPECSHYDQVHTYNWEHLGRWDQPPPLFFKNDDCWAKPDAPLPTTPVSPLSVATNFVSTIISESISKLPKPQSIPQPQPKEDPQPDPKDDWMLAETESDDEIDESLFEE